MNKKFFCALVVASLCSVGHAAKFEKTKQLESLDLLVELGDDFCTVMAPSNLDCSVEGYKIISRKDTEAVVNTVKQMIYATGDGYIESVSAKVLDKETDEGEEVLAQLDIVMEAAGLGNTEIGETSEAYNAADALMERFENDVSNNLVFVGGAFQGAFSIDYKFLAVVNLKRNEVMILSAGYSE